MYMYVCMCLESVFIAFVFLMEGKGGPTLAFCLFVRFWAFWPEPEPGLVSLFYSYCVYYDVDCVYNFSTNSVSYFFHRLSDGISLYHISHISYFFISFRFSTCFFSPSFLGFCKIIYRLNCFALSLTPVGLYESQFLFFISKKKKKDSNFWS